MASVLNVPGDVGVEPSLRLLSDAGETRPVTGVKGVIGVTAVPLVPEMAVFPVVVLTVGDVAACSQSTRSAKEQKLNTQHSFFLPPGAILEKLGRCRLRLGDVVSDESAELEGDLIDVGEPATNGGLGGLTGTGLVTIEAGSLLRN